jgi:CheY-like chemotaxis protein
MTDSSNSRSINLLLVEDDDDDANLIRRSLENEQIFDVLARVSDGIKALEFLRQQGDYCDAVRPDVILLDLNMPRMNGFEVLRTIKGDADLEAIPVVIFTSSDDERDVVASYKQKASSYVTKPVNIVRYRQILRAIHDYWSCVVTLPTRA